MEEKLWETEFMSINFTTGKVENVVSQHYFKAINFEEASTFLAQSGMTWLRLTGRWFDTAQEAINYNEFYKQLTNPRLITENMTFDEFLDWLELGTKEDIEEAIKAFSEEGLEEHVKVMKVHLKIKYGRKDKEEDSEESTEEEGS